MARYIDADAIPWEGFPNDFGEYHEDYVEKRVVDKMPTIEARPVVRGEWEEYQVPHIMCCSECDWGTEVQSDFKFCPNCGAEMRTREMKDG